MTENKLDIGSVKMLKSEQIQAEIDNKNAAIDKEALNGQQTNHDFIIQTRNEINVLQMQLSDAKTEESHQQEAQFQQQAKVLQIGGLKSTLSSIFEAAFPKDETVKVIGLTEYESTQQTFNQLVDQAVDEDQTALYAAFNTQLEQRDEKYRALTSQALDVQNQLDKANALIETQAETIKNRDETIDHLHNAAVSFDNDLHQKDIEIESLGQQLESAKETIFNLQKQINNVPVAPQIIDITPTAPSESLSYKIAAAKVASVTKFSNLYSDVTYTDGTKQVVHNSMLPPLEIPVLPPLKQVDSQNVEQGSDTQANAVNTFPSEENANNDVHSGGTQTTEGDQAVHEMVQQPALTLESLKAELDAIKTEHGARLDRLDKQANLPAVA